MIAIAAADLAGVKCACGARRIDDAVTAETRSQLVGTAAYAARVTNFVAKRHVTVEADVGVDEGAGRAEGGWEGRMRRELRAR